MNKTLKELKEDIKKEVQEMQKKMENVVENINFLIFSRFTWLDSNQQSYLQVLFIGLFMIGKVEVVSPTQPVLRTNYTHCASSHRFKVGDDDADENIPDVVGLSQYSPNIYPQI